MIKQFVFDFAVWLIDWLRVNADFDPQVINHYSAGLNTHAQIMQAPPMQAQGEDVGLFKYIHPAITDDRERFKVHREVVNLVTNFPLVDICKYLMQMKKEGRVYLGVKPALMFDELHRLGMPDENVSGFSYPNFINYFNVN